MKLYDLPMEFAAMEAALVESGGELTPELEQQYDALLRAGADKIEAAAKVVRMLEAQRDACKEEAARLADRAQSLENGKDRLKAMMIGAVDAFGGKVKTSLFTVYTQTSATQTHVDLVPGTELPRLAESDPDLVRVTHELNKQFIKEAIKSGQQLPECVVLTEVPGTKSLRIK
jgi:hypothetical protein